MVEPIDPQLGVPTTPNLDIPQIPYKKLPFPYQDLTNVPQPDNAQYYPDHIPGVVSTVAAMHPTGTQAQEIHTDGNHAMMVSDVNASGGPGLWAQAIPIGSQRDVLSPVSSDVIEYNTPRYFFALSATVAIFGFGNVGPGAGLWADSVHFGLNGLEGFLTLHLGGYYDGTMIHGTYCSSGTFIAPSPIDLQILGYNGRGRADITIINETAFQILVYLQPTFSQT